MIYQSSSAFSIGVTGGIGSGKSTVVRFLQKALGEQRVAVIDADAVAKSVTMAGGIAIPQIRDVFGIKAIDANGAMDRAFMRSLLVADPSAKAKLEVIMHPLIREQMDCEALQTDKPVILYDVPLLVESGETWLARLDWVCVVDCLVATQIKRVQQRNSSAGWNEEQIYKIIAMQASREQRRKVADIVIWNGDSVTLKDIDRHVQKLVDIL